jgi:hypothetical protein
MTKEEVRRFAVRAVDEPSSISMMPDRALRLAAALSVELDPRGALPNQTKLIAKAVLHAIDNCKTLTEARRILAAVWSGVLIVEN